MVEFVITINLILFDILHALFFILMVYCTPLLKNFLTVPSYTNGLILNNINFLCVRYLYAAKILKNIVSIILTAKNIAWKPLFKKTSYLGYFMSSSAKWKKL